MLSSVMLHRVRVARRHAEEEEGARRLRRPLLGGQDVQQVPAQTEQASERARCKGSGKGGAEEREGSARGLPCSRSRADETDAQSVDEFGDEEELFDEYAPGRVRAMPQRPVFTPTPEPSPRTK